MINLIIRCDGYIFRIYYICMYIVLVFIFIILINTFPILNFLNYKRDSLTQKAIYIAFRLCVYEKRNNGKVTTKYLFYNIDIFS